MALSKNLINGSEEEPTFLIAIPTSKDIITKGSIAFFDSNSLKSLTDIALTVRSNILRLISSSW